MGEPSIRTNERGESLLCHPPCEQFPEGREVLIPGPGSMRAKLNATQADCCSAHDELKQRQRARLDKARASLDAGNSVPHEKRCI